MENRIETMEHEMETGNNLGLEKRIIHCIAFLPPLTGKSKRKTEQKTLPLLYGERKPLILHRFMKVIYSTGAAKSVT